MKSFPLNGFRAATALAFALLLPGGLWAGEAIQFSNVKSRPDPNEKQKLPGDSTTPGLNFGGRGPMEGVTPGRYESRRRDPRAERKAQNAEDEKQNWMVLDRGQLDAEEEDNAAFGIKEYDFEKTKGKRDYFFAPPEDKGDRPGRPRPQSGRPPGKLRNPSDSGSKETSRGSEQGDTDTKGGQSVSKDGRPAGDQLSKDLDMKALLAPGKANSLAPAEDKTAKLWRDILGNGATSESRTDVPGRGADGLAADGFRPSASDSFRVQGSSPSFGFRNDFNARPATAGGSPGLYGSASSGFTPSATPSSPRASDSYLSRPASPVTADRVPTPSDPYSTRPDGFGAGQSGSSFGQQPPPRRPPSSGFEIPARPGYGGR